MRHLNRLVATTVATALIVTTQGKALCADGDYPRRPIRVLVGYAAGGVVDVVGRLFASELSIRLGQPVFIENLPGAFMQRPSEIVSRATPDGYTLMIGTSEMTMWPYLRKSYRFQLSSDFTPVSMLANNWTVFASYPGLPVTSLPEFVAYAKQNPGKLRYGSSGAGGVLHVVVELLKQSAGVDIIHVPYRGGSQTLQDLMAGNIELASVGLPSAQVAEGGRLRILAQAGPRRHSRLPDVPTTAEVGYPEVHVEPWFSLLGPPNLPSAIVNRLDTEIRAISDSADFNAKLEKIGFASSYMPHDKFVDYISDDLRRWKDLIPTMGIDQID
jgi:tripartite-type tricarboxylate transporter receptor subunit TctC